MSGRKLRYSEIKTFDDYLATLTEDERQEIAAAGIVIDLAMLVYRARESRGLTQKEAAERASMRQQAVSRLEQAGTNVQIVTLRKYLAALGYTLEISIRDTETGQVADSVGLPLVDELIPAD